MRGKLLLGNARKFSLIALIVSLLGWIIFIVFFGLASDSVYRLCNATSCVLTPRLDAYLVPHWVFLICGIFLYLFATLHLVFNARWYLAIVTQFLYAIFVLSAGAVIYSDWVLYYIPSKETEYLFEFGACTLAVAALIVSVLLWPQLAHTDSTEGSFMMVTEPDGGGDTVENKRKRKPNAIELKKLQPNNSSTGVNDYSYTEAPSTQVAQNIQPPQITVAVDITASNPPPLKAAPSPPILIADASLPSITGSLIPKGSTNDAIYQEPDSGKKSVHFEEIYDDTEPATLEDEDNYVEVINQQDGYKELTGPLDELGEYVDVQGGGVEEETYEDPTDFREGPEEQYEALS